MSEADIPILAESPQVLSARRKWQFTGTRRPDFAEPTSTGEESVWDFPRPPAIEPVAQPMRVFKSTQLIAETRNGVRVVETAGAPTYYFPPDDIVGSELTFGALSSICEWKGVAQEIDVAGIHNAGWRYVRMFEAFAELFEWVSFYPTKLRCFLGDEAVRAQPGGYYGGWVTNNLRGPIKGSPGSQGW
jgi:uncharacterized protein (DUF427 family)